MTGRYYHKGKVALMPNILGSIILDHDQAQELMVMFEAYRSLFYSDTRVKELASKNFELSWSNGNLTILLLNPIQKPRPTNFVYRMLGYKLENLIAKRKKDARGTH